MASSEQNMGTYAELVAKCKRLEEERNKRLKGEMLLAEAKNLVDDENTKMRAIQKFIGDSIRISDEEELIDLASELILEAFEYENVILLKRGEEVDHFKVVCDFEGPFTGQTLNLPLESWSYENSALFTQDHKWPEGWEDFGFASALACFLHDEDDQKIGLVISGNSKEGDDTYRPVLDTDISTFTVFISQLGSLLNNLKLINKLEDYTHQLENHKSNLETLVEERTREIKKLSLAVEQSPATVMITDSEGQIEYVNPRFVELTGFAAKEVIGKNPSILKSGVHSKEFYEDLWLTIKDEKTWYGEFCNKKKSGEIYWEFA